MFQQSGDIFYFQLILKSRILHQQYNSLKIKFLDIAQHIIFYYITCIYFNFQTMLKKTRFYVEKWINGDKAI